VLPKFFEIKKLDAFEDAAFAREIDDIFLFFGGNPTADDYVLVGAIIEVDQYVVKKNGIACDPQLNCAKAAVTADLDFTMVETAIELRTA
jgi:hypothetical protein